MIVHLLVYGLVVGMLLASSAWLFEGALRLHAKPLRWIWVAALLATAGLVASGPLRQSAGDSAPHLAVATEAQLGTPTDADAIPTLSARLNAFFAAAYGPIDVALSRVGAVLPSPSSPRLNRTVAVGWMVASGVLLLLFLSTILRSVRERRRWPQRCLHGVAVRVAPATGPMVAGVLHPEIVVPEWLLSSSAAEQRLVLTHEREHVHRRDPLLLSATFLLVALLPWNPAVWGMAARLRLAVEIDCDRRVLRGGATRAAYGSALLDIATRRTRTFFPAPALLESSSQLERRLIMMTPRLSRFAGARSLGLATLAGTLALAACDRGLPSAPEIEQMDVAAAEAGAERIGIVSLSDDPNTVYTIDGREVSAAEARALPAESIAGIEVIKATAEGAPSMVAILTPERSGAQSVNQAEGDAREVMIRPVPNDTLDPAKVDTVIEPRITISGDRMTTVKDQPLFIIDGRIAGTEEMEDFDVDGVEEVRILKGAAATKLYPDHPEARNGVILVTTKEPGEG